MNLASLAVGVVIVVLAGLAIRHGLKRKGGCACGCAGCKKACHNGK
ncbi:MAG: FeoB-associated Cys-rich membrane protein [Kiritimatiellia bacterium]